MFGREVGTRVEGAKERYPRRRSSSNHLYDGPFQQLPLASEYPAALTLLDFSIAPVWALTIPWLPIVRKLSSMNMNSSNGWKEGLKLGSLKA